MSNLELKVEKKEENKKIEKLINDSSKITEEKIENSLNYDELSVEEKRAVDEFNEKIDVLDSTQILQYGVSAQTKISEFSDSILEDVKSKDIGEAGDLLASLVSEIKGFDKSIGSNNKGIFKIFNNVKKR